MKLVLIDTAAGPHSGALLPGGLILDLAASSARFPRITGAMPASLAELLGPERLEQVRHLVQLVGSDRRLHEELLQVGCLVHEEAARLLPPLPHPNLILSSGGAYREHLQEMATEPAPAPVGFIKCASSISGPCDPIVLPATAPNMVDWEGEFSCVIGARCHQVGVDEALGYVAGYTLINDVSARDWVRPFLSATGSAMDVFRRGGDNLMGKQFPTFCPMGPCIVTKDELPDPANVTLTTRVNGEVMQHAHTSDLVFTLAQTISHFSQWYQFLPGDIITTGSPAGVGFARNPQRFLRAGDLVEVNVAEIGTLRNRVVGPFPHASQEGR